MPPFANRKQQAAVMIKLRKEGFTQKPMEIGVTKNYFRARLENPKKFQKGSFRVKDIGKKGDLKIIVARPKSSTKTRTQAVLVPKKAVYFDGKSFKSV